MIKILIFIILLICSNSYAGDIKSPEIKEPDPPKEPAISNVKLNTANTQIASCNTNIHTEAKSNKIDLYVYDVITVFHDNTILKGIISFTENSIKIKHKKKGFVFEKTILWNKVKSIKILEWKPKQGAKNKNTKLTAYTFSSSKYQITMKKGQKYIYNKNIPYLNKLVLTNKDGSTHIYSFFIDYWKSTGEKSGYWKNTMSSYFYAPVKNPLKKTITIINFK